MLAGGSEDLARLLLIFDQRDDLGYQAIEAGVGAIGETAQIVSHHLAVGQSSLEGLDQCVHFSCVL
ncbi:hypothetical protein SDC9_173720 [bioreactor metagenome]|uniref:Uncharacterized protein n=1 Tax=bioreactor metagenome TaxID=1076179 RepID=A0A645GJ82_9ZZZZ